MIINPYKIGSRSAKRLREELRQRGVPTWTLQRQPQHPNAFVVNWGNSEFLYGCDPYCVVNAPAFVASMTNKIRFFETTGHDRNVLEWTRDFDEAKNWGTKVFCRTKVEASGGKGIEVYDPDDPTFSLPKAPLYTKYVPKTHEYRLHMARSLTGKGFTVMLAQRKVFVKTPERPAPLDWKVRSHDNGFIFQAQPDLERVPPAAMEAASAVMHDHFRGLHFAALDVMYHDKRQQAWVIEGNTAPGLENNTVQIYADYFAALEKERKAA